MDTTLPCQFNVVDEANEARFPFGACFFPRAGDFINIGGICLKVVAVCINAAQSDRTAIQGNVDVYVEKTVPPFGNEDYDQQDLVEYSERVRDRLP